jgi:M61 glycyl aminopeptidase
VLLCGCRPHGGDAAARELQLATPRPTAARLGTHIPSQTGQERLVFNARIDPDLKRIDVELCPSGFRIERLNAPSPGAERLLEGGIISTARGAYPCPADGVDLPQSKPDECLQYAVNLPERSPDPTSLRRAGRDALVSPDLWLWVPSPRPEGVVMQLHFSMDDDLLALLPWQAELPESAFAWKSAGAFSHAPPTSLLVPGAELRVAFLGEGFAQPGAVRDWLVQGARASSFLFGSFPVPRALVIAVPGARGGPGFGMALRGGGPAVVISLDHRASTTSLARDWTATHEFLHLGVPRLPPEDAWLFEGLASYYTEVVRARAGIISPRRAYQNLLEGFERGRRNGSSLSLREESSQMRERRSFYRVYWAGAALAFLTDVETRRASGPTLDAALRSFSECCAASADEWTAERVLADLDQRLGAPRFTEHARRWLDRREFPELAGTLRALGVAPGVRGEAIYGPGPSAALRDAIMAPVAPRE